MSACARAQEDTGFKLRVVTQSQSRGRAPGEQSLREWWALSGPADPNAVVLYADRGLTGSLESGRSFLRFEIGDNVRFYLPEVFWGRLRREYGMQAFVAARGEAAAIVTSCEIILTCLRNEEYCTNVPSASSSYF